MGSRNLLAVAVLMVCGVLLVNGIPRPVEADQPSMRTQWEYKSIIEITQSDISVADSGLLNQAGSVGWELVAVLEGPTPRAKQFILKRPRSPKD